MNKEIKDKMPDNVKFVLEEINSNILRNYITNLQTKNEYLETWNSEIKIQLDTLQQENERLKERVAYLERSNNRREDTIIGLRFEVAEQEDYKSRCEKAIEYIKNNPLYEVLYDDNGNYFNTTDSQATDDLLNILQNGGDTSE